jgi:3,4-dihydroxy-9,10-secoandrosta-1,3,5(10)-triene-9,17-dione 4,5-dioxygenase
MDLRGIAYLGLHVPDVAAWQAFATTVVGLMPARSVPGENPMAPASAGAGRRDDDGTVFLKADERQWRVALHRCEHPGIAYAGFDLGSQAAFADAVAHLEALGAPFTRASADEVEARGVRDMVHLNDPTGLRVELSWGPTIDGGFVSPVGVPTFVAGELGFGHFVLLTPDLEASMDFYQRVLGMKLSDFVVLGPGMSVQFLRCTPRHHSVALTGVGPMTGVHHIAFEVGDIDQVGYALERATRAGHPITATLGRHKNDHMLSFYMRSPAGFDVEIGCGGRSVDDATWVVNHFTGGDEWGHHGLTGEALARSASDG